MHLKVTDRLYLFIFILVFQLLFITTSLLIKSPELDWFGIVPVSILMLSGSIVFGLYRTFFIRIRKSQQYFNNHLFTYFIPFVLTASIAPIYFLFLSQFVYLQARGVIRTGEDIIQVSLVEESIKPFALQDIEQEYEFSQYEIDKNPKFEYYYEIIVHNKTDKNQDLIVNKQLCLIENHRRVIEYTGQNCLPLGAIGMPFEKTKKVPPGDTKIYGHLPITRAGLYDPKTGDTILFDSSKFGVYVYIQTWGTNFTNTKFLKSTLDTWDYVFSVSPKKY